MENPNNMKNNTSTNYFFDWIVSNYLPNILVYSSETARKIIGKNNLTPSEFLRPFGNFSGTNINFSFGDKFTINLKNLKFDFYDSEKFSKFSLNMMNELSENLLVNNYPEWNLKILSSINKLSKSNIDPIFTRLKKFSFQWFNEYEKLFLESVNFNEYENYQQPFANIYIISVKDDKKEIDNLINKRNVPLLIEEGIYEKGVPTMILLLNDKSNSKDTISYDTSFKIAEGIRNSYPKHYIFLADINSNREKSEDIENEIWSKYFHKLDVYQFDHYRESKNKIGEFISIQERETFKSEIFKFFNDYIKIYLQKLVVDLDEEITSNKKGIRNGFLSIFKKSDKIEYVNTFNIYKLTPMERKLFLLSLIQFYFRDYENAMEHLKILMGDIKSKSVEHYNSIYEMFTICQFIISPGNKKEVDIEGPYNAYQKSKNIRSSLKYLLIQIKMLEHIKRYSDIPKLLIKATSELNIPFTSPLLLEKASIYYLLGTNPQIKKFIFFQVLAGMAYKNSTADFKRYTLNCYANVHKFFSKNSPSLIRLKEYLNSNIGEINLNIEYFDGALKFYKNCIELSTFKNIDQDQALYIRHFLKSLNSVGQSQGGGLSYIEINDLSIPEIINSSLLVIEEQDYEIGLNRITESSNNSFSNLLSPAKNLNWINFSKYSRVDINKIYINLSENDIQIIKNIDNILENKQNLSNIYSKRIFKGNVGSKIYVRFIMKNPLNLNLSISSLKLICEFIPEKSLQETSQDSKGLIETEEKSLLLEKNCSSLVTLCCIPKVPGRVIIQGLEIGLYKIALFKHSFYKKNASKLYKYRNRRDSISSQSSSSSNLILKQHQASHLNNSNNTREICFDVINDNQDINVNFPLGKEIEMFCNEILLMPVKIINNSIIKIKRMCLLFDDKNILIEKTSNINYENNVCLSSSIFKDIIDPKSNEFEVLVPICPKEAGEYFLKILIKFEEEMKLKEIDVKRFLIKIKVKPSVKFNINEEILFFNSNSTVFNLDVNAFIEDRESLSNFKIDQIYYNETFKQILTRYSNWILLENENYHKNYSKLKFMKMNNKGKTRNEDQELNLNLNSTSFKFGFLSDNIFKNHSHIVDRFNHLLCNDNIFFNWTAKSNISGNTVEGISIYRFKLITPMINKNFLRTIFKNSITVNINKNSNTCINTLVSVNFKINKRNLEELQDIMAYEFYINDEDFEFNWIGLSKFKIQNTPDIKDDNQDQNLIFNFMTSKKGLIELNNKINVTIYPKNQQEKPFSILNVPNTIFLEVN